MTPLCVSCPEWRCPHHGLSKEKRVDVSIPTECSFTFNQSHRPQQTRLHSAAELQSLLLFLNLLPVFGLIFLIRPIGHRLLSVKPLTQSQILHKRTWTCNPRTLKTAAATRGQPSYSRAETCSRQYKYSPKQPGATRVRKANIPREKTLYGHPPAKNITKLNLTC